MRENQQLADEFFDIQVNKDLPSVLSILELCQQAVIISHVSSDRLLTQTSLAPLNGNKKLPIIIGCLSFYYYLQLEIT